MVVTFLATKMLYYALKHLKYGFNFSR